MLTDKQLLDLINNGRVTITPFNEKNLKAGKYDVHLGNNLLIPQDTTEIIDPTNPKSSPKYAKFNLAEKSFILEPKQFVLGQTAELVGLPADVGMFLDGSTTLARIGLTIHQSANYIPPGQDAHIITLEIFNASPWRIKLVDGMRIGKFIAFKYSEENRINAKDFNRYNGQQETTGAIFAPNNGELPPHL